MGFKSKAHRRKCHELAAQGRMKKETVEAWEKEYEENGTPLPDRAQGRVILRRGTRRTTRTQRG